MSLMQARRRAALLQQHCELAHCRYYADINPQNGRWAVWVISRAGRSIVED